MLRYTHSFKFSAFQTKGRIKSSEVATCYLWLASLGAEQSIYLQLLISYTNDKKMNSKHTHTHTLASYLNGQMQKHTAQNKLQQNELKMKQARGGKHSRHSKECVVIKNARTLPWSPLEGERYLQPLFRLSLGHRVYESPQAKSCLGPLENMDSLWFLTPGAYWGHRGKEQLRKRNLWNKFHLKKKHMALNFWK